MKNAGFHETPVIANNTRKRRQNALIVLDVMEKLKKQAELSKNEDTKIHRKGRTALPRVVSPTLSIDHTLKDYEKMRKKMMGPQQSCNVCIENGKSIVYFLMVLFSLLNKNPTNRKSTALVAKSSAPLLEICLLEKGTPSWVMGIDWSDFYQHVVGITIQSKEERKRFRNVALLICKFYDSADRGWRSWYRRFSGHGTKNESFLQAYTCSSETCSVLWAKRICYKMHVAGRIEVRTNTCIAWMWYSTC